MTANNADPWTADEKLKAVERELTYRRRVFPKRVASGNMTQELMDKQIAIFEAIAIDYRKLAEAERLL